MHGLEYKKNLVGQSYDGAAGGGAHSGVQAKIKEVAKHAFYVHCSAHCVKGVSDTGNFLSLLEWLYIIVQQEMFDGPPRATDLMIHVGPADTWHIAMLWIGCLQFCGAWRNCISKSSTKVCWGQRDIGLAWFCWMPCTLPKGLERLQISYAKFHKVTYAPVYNSWPH